MGAGILGVLVVVLVVAAHIVGFILLNRRGGNSPNASSPSPPSTDVRVQVEQAYLRVWDVWADALLRRDSSRLSEVMTGNALARVRGQVEEAREKNQPVRIQVEHNYTIVIADATTAFVEDKYISHSVRLDPNTMEPIEPDPDQRVRESFTMRRVNGTWKLAEVIEHTAPSSSR